MTFKEKASGKLDSLREYVKYLKGYSACTIEDLKSDNTLFMSIRK